MIEMHQAPVPGSRTATTGIAWRATATVDGKEYEATSRREASTALARILVAIPLADQPVEVWDAGSKGPLKWPSLHVMATRTYSGEGVQRKWNPEKDAE